MLLRISSKIVSHSRSDGHSPPHSRSQLPDGPLNTDYDKMDTTDASTFHRVSTEMFPIEDLIILLHVLRLKHLM